VSVQQRIQALPRLLGQVWQSRLRGTGQHQPFKGRPGLRHRGRRLLRGAGEVLFEQEDQKLDLGRRGCAFQTEMHVLHRAQQVGIARHKHRREQVQARREDGRSQQPDDALDQPGLAGEREMVGRVVHLDEEQRPLNAHQAQPTPHRLARHVANHQKGGR